MRQKRFLAGLIPLAFVVALLLAACDTEEPAAEAPAEAPAPEVTTPADEQAAPAEEPDSFGEAPALAERVAQGDLPPVEERLPANPVVIEPEERAGDYGGTWTSATTGSADFGWVAMGVHFDHLVRIDPETLEIVPNIAERFEVSDDATEYTFYLREGMRWSDGEPFTAHDIAFWYNDYALVESLGGGAPSMMVTGDEPGVVEALDDHTVRFSFPGAPHGRLLQSLAADAGNWAVSTPRHYLEQFHADYNPDIDALVQESGQPDWESLFDDRAGAGQWRIQVDKPTLSPWVMTAALGEGPRVTFERNPYYWKVDTEGNQLPYLDAVVYDVVEDTEVLMFKAINGELNFHARHFNDPPNRPFLADHQESGDYRFFDVTPGSSNVGNIALNLTHKDPVMREIFQNKDFRIGLSHAIDRQELIDVVYQGLGEPWQAAPHPDSRYYHEELARQYTEYDLDLANEHLDAAGYSERDAEGFRLGPDGRRIAFQVDTMVGGREEHWADAMDLVARYWAEVGVDMQVNLLDRSLLQVRSGDNDQDALIFTGWGGDDLTVIIDPRWYFPIATSQHNFAALWAHWYLGNPQGEEPPEATRRQMELYDQLLTTPDPDEQDRLMMEILDIAQEEFYVIGLVHQTNLYGIAGNDFRNVPDAIPFSWPYYTPGLGRPEQFFIEQG